MIYNRQYQKLLTRELLAYLIRGTLPDINEIAKRLEEAAKKNGNITFKYLPQLKGEVFNNVLFNRQLNAIAFDIETVHEELIDLVLGSMRRLNYADLYYRTHSYELSKLESILNSILFTFDKADFFFLGAYDSFSDYSKTNKDESDQDIINLSEKAIMLPYGGRNTKRINSSHLINQKTIPISVLTPRSVVASKPVTSTSFGDIFTDVATGWLHEIVTSEQTPITIEFKFPIAGNASENVEVLVNRFEITSHSSTPQKAVIQFSVDDVNYKKPEGYENGILLTDQKISYGMDFVTELAQYVKITLTKETFDEEIGTNENKQYIYRFGLKGFAALSSGRKAYARYQSKPFDFSKEEEKISRVSIKSDYAIPVGTKIDYSIALVDAQGNQVSSFMPIKPIKGDGTPGASEIVVFGTTQLNERYFDADSSLFTQYTTNKIRGHTYYQFSSDISPMPVFGSAQMFRGYHVWSRDKSLAIQNIKISDNYVSFINGDIERVYALYTEVPIAQNDTINSKPVVKLVTTQSVYYDGKGALVPKGNQQKTGSDATPNYAIYKVQHITDSPTKTFNVTANSNKVKLNFDSFIVNGATAPVIKNSTGTLTYVAGKDYIVETEIKEGILRSTGYIVIVPTGQINTLSGPTLSVTLTLDSDVTYKVTSINGNNVTLSDMSFTSGDSFQITYRFIPLAPYEIIQSSVRVKSSIAANGTKKFYVEGVDYLFDPVNGAIQRLPNGSIPSLGEVFVDFFYKNIDNSIETFLTWVNITEERGVQIKFEVDTNTKKNRLVSDETVGERLFVNTSAGLVDLTKATVSPVLGPGWVQFIVRSKNPDVNQKTDGTGNLVDQVIQVRDVNKKRVFVANGKYFKEIVALRDPMIQRSINHLKNNTLTSDHSVFALDDISNINRSVLVLNFKPGQTNELYLKVPQEAASELVAPATINEIYKITWESRNGSTVSGTGVVVRCDLYREPNIDGGITPKVFEYFLRVGK